MTESATRVPYPQPPIHPAYAEIAAGVEAIRRERRERNLPPPPDPDLLHFQELIRDGQDEQAARFIRQIRRELEAQKARRDKALT